MECLKLLILVDTSIYILKKSLTKIKNRSNKKQMSKNNNLIQKSMKIKMKIKTFITLFNKVC
jgi:hypothetical protein